MIIQLFSQAKEPRETLQQPTGDERLGVCGGGATGRVGVLHIEAP